MLAIRKQLSTIFINPYVQRKRRQTLLNDENLAKDSILTLNFHKRKTEPQTEPQEGKNKKPADFQRVSFSWSGENRIRTCEPVLPVTRFPEVLFLCTKNMPFPLYLLVFQTI
jgi:hypothetical protein